MISSSHTPLPDNTWHSQQTNIHAPGGVWTHDLSRRAAADRGFESHRGACIFVCCECRVLSGRGLCDELITRPEESYRLCCVVVCDLETSRMGAPYVDDISRLRVNEVADRTGFWFCQVVLWLVLFTVKRHFILMRWKNGVKHSLFEQCDGCAWSWSGIHSILMQVQVPDRVWVCCFNIVKCHHLMMLIKRRHASQTWLGYCDETF